MKTPVIHWFRRDLRISDNTALLAASETGLPVLLVYVLSDWNWSHAWTGPKRQQFLCGCLDSLARNLESIEGKLHFRRGRAVEQLARLVAETGARAIYLNKDPDPFGRKIEGILGVWCKENGIELHAYDDLTMHRADEVLTQTGQPYKIYTPYSRNWLSLGKRSPAGKPRRLTTPLGVFSEPVPTLETWGLRSENWELPESGERAARSRLKQALAGRIVRYEEHRNIPGVTGTSRISQDLRFGLISIRRVYAEVSRLMGSLAPGGRHGCETFVKELAWREFYFAILHHFPKVLNEEFNSDWLGLPWEEPGEGWCAWTQGRTGFPIVDAGIRELLSTGFMHNRVRMITAMFLTKDLHVDWRHGESFFMQHLVDGEIASNNGGWQWSAGTGADAAPYFRIQNPWSQSSRYDPHGVYIKHWIPELRDVDPKRFGSPPEQGACLSHDYPLPCVDHKIERQRALGIFKRHRETTR